MVAKALALLLLAIFMAGCSAHKAQQYCGKAASTVQDMIGGDRSDWREAYDACMRDPNEPWMR